VTPASQAGRGHAVSVVVCAYTEARWTELCAAVESLRLQTAPPDEVVVVVDHNPGLLTRARTELRDALVVANREPRGLSGARNSGSAAARGSLIAFLDDDAVADRPWLAHLAACFDDANVIGVGGAVEAQWESPRPGWFPAEFDWVVGCSYVGMPERRAAVRNPIGASMAFRRVVFEGVGGFRSGIGRVGTRPVGCEETELSLRALRRWPQARIVYEPRARVSHRVAPERATWRYFFGRCYAEGRSKALVARVAGSQAGLSAEWGYAFRTLPLGFARSLRAAIVSRDTQAAARAAVLVGALVVTTCGYAVGIVRARATRRGRREAAELERRPTQFAPPLAESEVLTHA
jgi:GT2 family glycosyltransferase